MCGTVFDLFRLEEVEDDGSGNNPDVVLVTFEERTVEDLERGFDDENLSRSDRILSAGFELATLVDPRLDDPVIRSSLSCTLSSSHSRILYLQCAGYVILHRGTSDCSGGRQDRGTENRC